MPDRSPGVDAEQFLDLTSRLRAAFAAVADADLTLDRKDRWQRRLRGIADVAKDDLSTALEQLERFRADWERHVERPRGSRPVRDR